MHEALTCNTLLTMVHFRKATAQDVSAICALINRMGIIPYSLDWRRFLVAVDEQGRLIAIGQIKPHGNGSRELTSIAVQPEWQSNRIGRAMVERLLAETDLSRCPAPGQHALYGTTGVTFPSFPQPDR